MVLGPFANNQLIFKGSRLLKTLWDLHELCHALETDGQQFVTSFWNFFRGFKVFSKQFVKCNMLKNYIIYFMQVPFDEGLICELLVRILWKCERVF
jgi:hypothetical protein